MTEGQQAALLRMHKEATMGRLVSGLVHELRNPLNAIANSGQLLKERGEEEALRDRLLPVIARSSERIHKLLDALELHRPEKHARGPIDLHDALRSCMAVLVHAVRHASYHPFGVSGVALVEGEPHILWFVLLSLLEASLSSGAKTLWVRSTSQETCRALVIEHDGAMGGKDQEDTGLAMRLSRILVLQMAGELTWSTREPQGSCVTLTLRKAGSGSNGQDSLR